MRESEWCKCGQWLIGTRHDCKEKKKMWKPTTEEKIATVLILMRYVEDGERFATREELKMLLADPMAYPRYSEAEAVRKAARFLNAITKESSKCK